VFVLEHLELYNRLLLLNINSINFKTYKKMLIRNL
jgi:hypothetical protein